MPDLETTPPLTTAEEFRRAGKEQLDRGAPLQAYDLLTEGLAQFPGDVRLRQLVALALARSGASQSAHDILEALAAEGHSDEETLGLLARTHKDLWAAAPDPKARQRHLARAFGHYQQAYRSSGGFWTGINAATMALLLNERETAGAIARAVREQCLALGASKAGSDDAYWRLSALGEAALILQEFGESENWYGQAAQAAQRRWADVASTRRNARLILAGLGADTGRIDRWLPVPPVIVFAGHLIDAPDRAVPRFPPSLEADVRAAILDELRQIRPAFGYGSAACGADILFLEGLLEIGGETHIVLPYNQAQFLKASVDIVPGANWTTRCERLLETAAEVFVASTQRIPGGMSYAYGAQVLDGLAAMRADELDTNLVCLAVWDGRPGGGPGGTAATVEQWRAAGRSVRIIGTSRMLARLPGGSPVEAPPSAAADEASASAPASGGFRPQIVSMVFADAKGFSKLTEDEIPLFVDHFLGAVATEVAALRQAPVFSNTWGDGLYFVFNDVREAGECALRLSEVVEGTDWIAKGFSHDLSLRIGLHVGPAYACLDPVIGRENFVGVHVSRAARIEPITPPGQVYASGAFAALARGAGVDAFTCQYVGRMEQAKGYGVFPTYVVHRRHADSSAPLRASS